MLVGGGVQLYRVHSVFGGGAFQAFLMFLLPGVLVLGAALLSARWPKNKWLHGAGLMGFACAATVFFVLSLGLEMWVSAQPVSDIRAYEKILNQWKSWAPEMVSHFPQSVPADADDISFYFFPGVLQADAEIQLRFRTTPEKILAYYEHFSGMKTRSDFGMTLIHFSPRGGEGQIIELGEDYEVLGLNPEMEQIAEHVKEYGVIISREKNEIVFWAEW